MGFKCSYFILWNTFNYTYESKRETKSTRKKKNASTYIRDITVNPRVLSEEEKLRLHMMGVGHSKKKMKEFVQRMKKIEEDKEEKNKLVYNIKCIFLLSF